MIQQIRNETKYWASKLGDYQSISINELADNYCKAIDEQDEKGMNSYLSALILRFWYVIGKTYNNNKNTGLDQEDFYNMLADCINIACEYRTWQKPDSKTNAQACINQCISTRGIRAIYYNSNLDKNRANYDTVSLDAPLVTNDSDNHTLLQDVLIHDELDVQASTDSLLDGIVQQYINKKQPVEAIVIDNILYGDVIRQTKSSEVEIDPITNSKTTTTNYYSEFMPTKLTAILADLPADYAEYFNSRYTINSELLVAALSSIKGANNNRLRRTVEKTLNSLRATISL